ncbi:MAG: hypothetical protein KGH94_02790 [Candidatus Micrarchaeota archaeon]|nr:hypothetical protein [Candidatus Micrarchaeota archaeon]
MWGRGGTKDKGTRPSDDTALIRVVKRDDREGEFYASVNRWVGSKKLFISAKNNDWWNVVSRAADKAHRHFVLEVRERSEARKPSVVLELTKPDGVLTLRDVEREVNRVYNGPVKRLLRRPSRKREHLGIVLHVKDQ